jgi:AraC-like DNA-binding protein
MLVLAAVSDIQFHRLRSAVEPDFELVRAATWDDALEMIRSRPVEIAVVDPMLGGARGREVERLRVLFPSLPLALYMPTLTSDLVPVLLAMGKIGIDDYVLSGTEDHPQNLRAMIREKCADASSQLLFDKLSVTLATLPNELRWVLENTLRTPGVQTIQQLAAHARVDRGTCTRWFTRAGLPSPRKILAAARVLFAHRLLQDPGFTIEDVAKRLGYAQVKTLQQHARTYLGLTAGEMRLSLTPDEAIAVIVRDFLTPARRPAARSKSPRAAGGRSGA